MTMKEIAALAGVSASTVSRVMNDDKSISDKTKQKVLAIINENNYSRNYLGRNLRKSSSNAILFMMPTITNPFYSEIFRGIEETAEGYGYEVLACVTNNRTYYEEKYLNLLASKGVDGVISAFNLLDKEKLEAISSNYPFVQVCEHTINSNLSHVSIDNEKAAYEAIQFLINKGHKKIAMIGGNFYKFSESLRTLGYKKALTEADIAYSPQLVMCGGDYQYLNGYEKCCNLFNRAQKPSAVFCLSDSLAFGAIKYFHDQNILPGTDVDIIGFDNTAISTMSHPTLSTISQPQYQLGATAMELLYEKIENISADVRGIVLPHELILRNSTSNLSVQ